MRKSHFIIISLLYFQKRKKNHSVVLCANSKCAQKQVDVNLSRTEREGERKRDREGERGSGVMWGCNPPLFAPLFSRAEVKMLRAGNTKAELSAGRNAGLGQRGFMNHFNWHRRSRDSLRVRRIHFYPSLTSPLALSLHSGVRGHHSRGRWRNAILLDLLWCGEEERIFTLIPCDFLSRPSQHSLILLTPTLWAFQDPSCPLQDFQTASCPLRDFHSSFRILFRKVEDHFSKIDTSIAISSLSL